MTLAVGVTKTVGKFDLSASFESMGKVTALFGRSGAGKTTLVNAISGLVRPDSGRIAIDDTVLFDAAQRINVPVHRRGVGYVFQEGRLFPHLSVRANCSTAAASPTAATAGVRWTRSSACSAAPSSTVGRRSRAARSSGGDGRALLASACC